MLLGVVSILSGAAVLVLVSQKTSIKSREAKSGPCIRDMKKAVQPRNRWRAKSIFCDNHACKAAKSIGNERFLETDKNIPVLPLPNCDASKCNCTYVSHEVRRDDNDDRRLPGSLQSELYEATGKISRRQKKCGRRKHDWGYRPTPKASG